MDADESTKSGLFDKTVEVCCLQAEIGYDVVRRFEVKPARLSIPTELMTAAPKTRMFIFQQSA